MLGMSEKDFDIGSNGPALLGLVVLTENLIHVIVAIIKYVLVESNAWRRRYGQFRSFENE